MQTFNTLSGKITLPDGTPLAGVGVVASPAGTNTDLPSVTTDTNGNYSYQLSSGSYDLELRMSLDNLEGVVGHIFYDKSNKDIEVSSDIVLDIPINLVKIIGKVTDANGVGVADAYIGISGEYSIYDPDTGSNIGWFSGYAENYVSSSELADSNGNYIFWVPPKNNYTVLLTPPEESGFALTSVSH